ncbi:uncharacterized protein LOC120180286 [Hibiscus syriacus]|uniref:uncharacterized protein LOC120180286 n=1 Tax=Hibiscus syriacus TaxID=106335 RepID=UPI0019251198|nr:uncharacterized protein LOC120180286 [Hibiscus syriacus]
MVAASNGARRVLNAGCGINDDEVIVSDEDCIIDRSGEFPSINFSNRVHDCIDRNMRNVIIVRLLGCTIGYKALLNHINALWKPVGEIQLINLDNYYYLVKFADAGNYAKVLTECPWTIYGSYLTVQPWSRSFTTFEKHPSEVIVWIRLPGLLYRYYTKALFRLHATVVGRAGCTGRSKSAPYTVYRNLKYEGLQQICFHCGVYGHSKEQCAANNPPADIVTDKEIEDSEANSHSTENNSSKFDPWMIVDNRKKRYGNNNKTSDANEDTTKVVQRSRFSIL